MVLPPIIHDDVYNYYLKKYRGDRIKAISSTDEVFKYIKLYAKHISEVKPSKRIPKYCFGQTCFETVSRKKLFRSIYPGIADILEEIPITPPVPPVIERYVSFDLMIAMYYKTAVASDARIVRRIRGCSIYEHSEKFSSSMKEWVKMVTERRRHIESLTMEDEIRGDLFSDAYYDEQKYGFSNAIKIIFQTEEVLII